RVTPAQISSQSQRDRAPIRPQNCRSHLWTACYDIVGGGRRAGWIDCFVEASADVPAIEAPDGNQSWALEIGKHVQTRASAGEIAVHGQAVNAGIGRVGDRVRNLPIS